MALCESEDHKPEPGQIPNDDLEDGEIEDDDDDTIAPASESTPKDPPSTPPKPQQPQQQEPTPKQHEKSDRSKERRRHQESKGKKNQPMTEAEKSVMYLHQLERMERDKREKYRREPVDDFASNLEKQIANVLKKDHRLSGDDDHDEKRGKKRRKRERDRRKRRKMGGGIDEIVDTEMGVDNSVQHLTSESIDFHQSPRSEIDSYSDDQDSICSERSGGAEEKTRRPRRDRRGRMRERNRNRRNEHREKKLQQQQNQQQQQQQQDNSTNKDPSQLCMYYLQGKCQKGDECQYSHESQPPMKWELCKFYLNDCCAKGDKCFYMHSDFPCKFYHTGQQCLESDNCKFAHGKPLNERLKQILFKHIETAPKDILGRFPRMSREEASFKINQTQKELEAHFGPPDADPNMLPLPFDVGLGNNNSDGNHDAKKDKDKPRNRPSRWQDPEPVNRSGMGQAAFPGKGFGQDLDMRLQQNNGDVDMRTLQLSLPQGPPNLMMPPPNLSIPPPNILMMNPPPMVRSIDIPQQLNLNQPQFNQQNQQFPLQQNVSNNSDVDIRNLRGDTDIRNFNNVIESSPKKINTEEDFAIKPQKRDDFTSNKDLDDDYEPSLEIITDQVPSEIPANLPKRQRELFMRIQSQQKQNLLEDQKDDDSDNDENNIDWYSDDSNDGKLTIKCDDDFVMKEKDEEKDLDEDKSKTSPEFGPLGDLSQITISEEVSKLLNTFRGGTNLPQSPNRKEEKSPPKSVRADPRKARVDSGDDTKVVRDKISIYEQGSICGKDVDLRSDEKDTDLRTNFGDMDLRSSRPDVDLRQLGLPFKAMQNYTPATEIDASLSTHLPIHWFVHIVDIPKPDYTGLKLTVQDAHTTGDPRLRKIFRLDLDEKDSPASPKQSPKAGASAAPRVDPRIRKEEVKNEPMSYSQQMAMLQSSPFYQNLTSNQKVKLNQELSVRDPNTGGNNEQILQGILSTLGLVQCTGQASNINGAVLSLLAKTNLGMMLNQNINPNLNLNPNLNQGLMQNQNLLQNQNLMIQNAGLIPNPNLIQNPSLLQNQSLIQNQSLLQNPALLQNPSLIQTQLQNQSLITPQNPNLQLNVQNQSGLGLLGQNPSINEFPINFDPRNGGLLGNAPPFANFNPDNNNFNFAEDNFYQDNNFGGGNNNNNNNNNNNGGGGGGNNNNNSGNNNNQRENRGFHNREGGGRGGRRGRNFMRNNRNNNFRNRNRANRGHNNS